MYSTFFEISSIEFTTISSSFSLLSYLNSTYFTLGLSYGLHNTDFYYGLELSSPSLSFCDGLHGIFYYILGGLIVLLVPISTVIGKGINDKKNFKLYNQRRAFHEKNKPYYLINLIKVQITQGPYAGMFILKDSNSIAGVAISQLGPHPSIGLYQVGPDLVWGILSVPSINTIYFHINTVSINRFGRYNILYNSRILVHLPNYSQTPLGYSVLTFT